MNFGPVKRPKDFKKDASPANFSYTKYEKAEKEYQEELAKQKEWEKKRDE